MLQLSMRFRNWWLTSGRGSLVRWVRGVRRDGIREEGQTTAEYALVLLAAAAVALVLIDWARTSGKLPAFFDSVIDDIMGEVP